MKPGPSARASAAAVPRPMKSLRLIPVIRRGYKRDAGGRAGWPGPDAAQPGAVSQRRPRHLEASQNDAREEQHGAVADATTAAAAVRVSGVPARSAPGS